MLQARYPATSFLGAFLLLAGLPNKSAAGEPPTRIRLAGIFKLSDGPSMGRASVLENAVVSRLGGLDLAVELAPTYAEPCKEASCLPQLAEKNGANLALTGTVYHATGLCIANLWLYDRRSAQVHSTEIRCHPGASEESLAAEFADQVGRLSERAQGPAVPLTPSVALLSQPMQALVAQPRVHDSGPPWDLKRKTTVPMLVATTAGFIGAAIVTSILAGTFHDPDGSAPHGSPPGVVAATATLWGIAAVSAAGLTGVTIFWERKR